MPSLTLKNVPEDLLHDLREAATAERRSLNQQALQLLLEALRTRGPEKPRRVRSAGQIAAWRALAGTWRSDEDAATEIKRIYAKRTRTRGRRTKL